MEESDLADLDTIHVVDVGNSSAKFGTFSGDDNRSPIRTGAIRSDAGSFDAIANSVDRFRADTPWLLASVCRPMSDRLGAWVRTQFPAAEIHELCNDECPIEIDVEKPAQVGIDRLLGAVAANELRAAGRPAIVVDTGSAITVDAVSNEGVFLGGVIMAGFSMRTAALASNTDLLPLVEADGAIDIPPIIGRSTEAAIRSGIFWGTIGSIREVIARMETQIGDAEVFVTGGDMIRMTEHFKGTARFEPNLVLSGLAIAARHRKGML